MPAPEEATEILLDVLPAIDLREGKVVRLMQGDYGRQRTYSEDPLAVADAFIAAGAKWIHVVDLDGARSGRRENITTIRELCRRVDGQAAVECGGGVRTRATIQELLDQGVRRVVVGSAALKNPSWFQGLLDDPGLPNGQLALGLDARGEKLAAEGWTEQLEQGPREWAKRMRGSGLGAIVYTDIARDGMLTGVNVEATAALAASTDVPVIASGGVASMADVEACLRANCAGVIIGRAYYDGRIDLAQAVRAAALG